LLLLLIHEKYDCFIIICSQFWFDVVSQMGVEGMMAWLDIKTLAIVLEIILNPMKKLVKVTA